AVRWRWTPRAGSGRRPAGEGWGLGAVPSLVLGTLRLQVAKHRAAVAVTSYGDSSTDEPT
ncbi:hypothetical protein, partial [Halolamina salina]